MGRNGWYFVNDHRPEERVFRSYGLVFVCVCVCVRARIMKEGRLLEIMLHMSSPRRRRRKTRGRLTCNSDS
jgi:hypothetical protein